MKILGEINHILGTDVKVNTPYNTIHLSQQQYIKNTYNTFKEYGIYNYTTPMDSRVHLSKAMSSAPRYEEDTLQRAYWISSVDRKWYITLKGFTKGTEVCVCHSEGLC